MKTVRIAVFVAATLLLSRIIVELANLVLSLHEEDRLTMITMWRTM